MSKLFEDDDSGSDIDLKTDTDYAKNYNTWRQKEELHRLQMKYGDESSDESSSSSDDDEGEEVNDKFEKDFFKTLSCLKNKDPRIYDKNYDFFEKTEEDNTSNALTKKKKKEQPVYVKDYERKLILEKGGQLSDEEEENPQLKSSTYVEEQETLKENLKNALKGIDEIEEGEWGGLFKTRQKTAEEKIKEEEDYKQWLAGQSEHLEDENVKSELKPLKDFWSNPKLEEGEKFLRDYILKKKFLDSEDKDYIPTYEEVIHDSDKGLSEDEEAVSKQEQFEHKFNFRFEEPDQEFIKHYPRTMENSVRQKDDKRKIKRSERKERKKVEKQQKMEEIKQLKELKKIEIEEKIKKLQEITGNTEVGFEMKDLEDDFDPEEHDKRMQSLFSNEFYEGPEGEQKPEFPEIDEELELENWDRWHGNEDGEDGNNANGEYEPHCEDENFNMDCDFDPANTQKELIDNSKKKKKRRRKSKFAKVVSQPKPIFDPNDITYQEYLDEYYKLDCEDIIGDVPCRFKYRDVVPNSFGLSVEEILMAKDKELNRWCSLKKAIQYRPEHVEKYDVIAFDRKGKNINLKKKYLPSLFTEEEETEEIRPSTSSSNEVNKDNKTEVDKNNTNTSEVKKKKKKNKKEPTEELQNNDGSDGKTIEVKKRKRELFNNNKKTSKKMKTDDVGISDARLAAYGFNPKKFKNKLKYGSHD